MALVFILFPLVLYVSLCALPKERVGMGIGLAAAALAVVWLTNDPAGDDGFTRLLVMIGAVPVALAALAQGLRRLLPMEAAGWVWPALVAGLGLSAFLIFFMML
jgi:hypothetical protein